MADLRSEEEQLDVVKRWWKENGTSLIAGAVLAAAGVFGWNAWQNYQEGQSEAASARYQQLVTITAANSLEEEQRAAARELISELTDQHGRTLYAELAQLLEARLAVQALEHAVDTRARAGVDVAGCIVHSDRGSQFRSRKYLRALSRHDLLGSMGQVGSSADNAAMESWFALLQKNVLDRRTWDTRDQLRLAIVTWTERTYHRRRRQARLGKLTPIEYETIMTTAATQAA